MCVCVCLQNQFLNHYQVDNKIITILFNMDVVEAMKNYITEMVKETGTGIKALLMDKETVNSLQILANFIILLRLLISDFNRVSCLCSIGNVGERSLFIRTN